MNFYPQKLPYSSLENNMGPTDGRTVGHGLLYSRLYKEAGKKDGAKQKKMKNGEQPASFCYHVLIDLTGSAAGREREFQESSNDKTGRTLL